jgi:hypothetical protein
MERFSRIVLKIEGVQSRMGDTGVLQTVFSGNDQGKIQVCPRRGVPFGATSLKIAPQID